jgi:mannose-6-phosphate isomerase-like protein (cupin superfamily)
MRRLRASEFIDVVRPASSMPIRVRAGGDEYIVKLRGAGQGVRALACEVIVAELAEQLGLRVPERAIIDIPPAFVRNRDHELVELLERSVGDNLGLRWLDASPATDVDPLLAAKILAFDTFLMNVDRRRKNPNLLRANGEVYLIDHGAVLLFEHAPDDPAMRERVVYDHVFGGAPPAALEITDEQIARAVAAVPREWLPDPDAFVATLRARRDAPWSARMHIGNLNEGGREAGRIRGTLELLGEWIDLADRSGLRDVRVLHERLRPGRRSSSPHYHTHAEELVLVLSGAVTLIIEGRETLLRARDYIGFRAGHAERHHLRNDGDVDAEYVVIATKPAGDATVY